MPVGKFILGSLSRTLPQVYINCDARALDAISREVNDKTAKLFMNFSHNILAYVFCLTGPGQTNKVLNFILSVLKNSAQQKVDLALVIRSCVVPLVAEIVLGLGDDDPDRVDAVGLPHFHLSYTCSDRDVTGKARAEEGRTCCSAVSIMCSG